MERNTDMEMPTQEQIEKIQAETLEKVGPMLGELMTLSDDIRLIALAFAGAAQLSIFACAALAKLPDPELSNTYAVSEVLTAIFAAAMTQNKSYAFVEQMEKEMREKFQLVEQKPTVN